MNIDVESIERATVAAVAPPHCDESAGWLLPYDSGTVGRAKSTVPLGHESPDLGVVAQIEARYAARGLPCVFRIPEVAAFDAMREILRGRGYGLSQPTQVQVAHARHVANASSAAAAQVARPLQAAGRAQAEPAEPAGTSGGAALATTPLNGAGGAPRPVAPCSSTTAPGCPPAWLPRTAAASISRRLRRFHWPDRPGPTRRRPVARSRLRSAVGRGSVDPSRPHPQPFPGARYPPIDGCSVRMLIE